MTSRVRQSIVAPTQPRAGNQLPPYEAPQFSLNPTAQRKLAQLTHTHSLKALDDHLGEAQGALSVTAGEINDRLQEKQRVMEKRKEQEGDNDVGTEIEQSLAELRDKVERMTQRMDESMRKLIDGQHSVQFTKDSIAATANDARVNASTQASTQNVRSQRQRRQRVGSGDDEDDDADESYQDFDPTDPAGATQGHPAPVETFRSKMEDAKTRYQSHSLTARYAENNDYRNFRRVVHDAQHHNEDVPLAHHSEWFCEGEAPAPGVTTRARAIVDDEDDDDIAVSRASISTKCPLTLQEFKMPLTSTKCPHSFESEAILSMIGSSANREGPRGERIVQCPVPGCSQRLTDNDLQTDAVLIRKIKRIQRAKELEEEEAEDDEGNQGRGTQRDATLIDDDEDGADVDDIVEGRVEVKTQTKAEPRGTQSVVPPSSNVPPRSSAAVVELGSSTDDDEADEEDATSE